MGASQSTDATCQSRPNVLQQRHTMSDVPSPCMGLKPATSQSRPTAPGETAPSSFWQMISQDRANHDNPQRYFLAETTQSLCDAMSGRLGRAKSAPVFV